MITWSSKSRRQLPTQRSATPFRFGLRKAVRVGWLPVSLTAETTSAPNFASRSKARIDVGVALRFGVLRAVGPLALQQRHGTPGHCLPPFVNWRDQRRGIAMQQATRLASTAWKPSSMWQQQNILPSFLAKQKARSADFAGTLGAVLGGVTPEAADASPPRL